MNRLPLPPSPSASRRDGTWTHRTVSFRDVRYRHPRPTCAGLPTGARSSTPSRLVRRG
jgi:hypothetical protein